MKRIWNALGKKTKDSHYQKKAVERVADIESGKVKAAVAPRHATEEKHFQEATHDASIKEDLDKKHDSLLENMQKITINSTNPVERTISNKSLPTRETEYHHQNDPIWEYGFYEPATEKIPKNKLTFREALEILRARQQFDVEGSSPATAKIREQAKSILDDHKAVARVDLDKLDEMYEYFRPFERKDLQKVVSKHDLAQLQDHLKGHVEEISLTQGTRDHVRELLHTNRVSLENYDRLEDSEKKEFKEAVKQLQDEQHERLQKRLKDINQTEEALNKAIKEQREKFQEQKKGKEKE